MKRTLKAGLSLFAAMTTFFAVIAVMVAGPAAADIQGCPQNQGNPQVSNLVGASFSSDGNTVTYTFDSFTNENPSGGVPGLIEYCIYPGILPDSAVAEAIGDNNTAWTDPTFGDNFSFQRPDGNPSNIGFDGTSIEMGTATWTAGAPTDQTILLHINDTAECTSLYGSGSTCFVLPGSPQAPQAQAPTVSKTASPSSTETFIWGISKAVDKTQINIADGGTATFNYTVNVTHDSGTPGGWKVTGNIAVTNPNSTDSITLSSITDSINDANATCNVTVGSLSVAPGTTLYPYECDYSAAPSANTETNTATIAWNGQTLPTDGLLAAGSDSKDVNFTFGNPTVVNGSVTVTDTLGGTLGTVSSSDPSPTSFTYSHDFTGVGGTCTNYDNTATLVETNQSASQTVTVCVGKDLTVSKDATPSFTRTYVWGITKAVDKTLVEQIGGGTATFNYTVNVTHDGGTDGNWKVNGTITVNNPNDWEAITANVADVVGNGGNCTVTPGSLTVPKSGSAQATYECDYSSAPSPLAGTNTATASWDAGTYFTPTGSASGTASFDFGATSPTIVDGSVVVTDSLAGALGSASYTDPSPKTFTYSLTFNVPINNCQFHTNTASFVTNSTGTKGSASQTVELCGPAKTGALTMGYWQNKNGQSIITKSGPSTGTCALTTWLRGYAPFQDLSATATCTQDATYVYNVIKAANAGGATMNAMLKAQMLATALDVYFSDPALGGNKINAPAPIGGVTIDLTNICHMIDSNGNGTCTGTFENVSSAFGGATSMTVSQMLAYAASQSNAGGTVWYGQVKTTQGLAKDAFDAINNQVAFSP
jgi:hypothetical protein